MQQQRTARDCRRRIRCGTEFKISTRYTMMKKKRSCKASRNIRSVGLRLSIYHILFLLREFHRKFLQNVDIAKKRFSSQNCRRILEQKTQRTYSKISRKLRTPKFSENFGIQPQSSCSKFLGKFRENENSYKFDAQSSCSKFVGKFCVNEIS